jgi:hypothetical protein
MALTAVATDVDYYSLEAMGVDDVTMSVVTIHQ